MLVFSRRRRDNFDLFRPHLQGWELETHPWFWNQLLKL